MLSEAGLFPRLVDKRLVFPDLAGSTVEEALAEMSAGLARAGSVRDADDLARRLVERERMGSTGLGAGIAIPHCKVRDLADVVLAIGVSRAGIDFRAPDAAPVTLVFLVLSPSEAPALHLQALARISRIIRMPGVAESLRAAPTAEAIAAILKDAERQLAVPV
ncbi:MAG TPA: PTS sugar transporter subunit IIA [Thermoanaerobaculia bacterium]|jgi:PTS system nitrogen regulatory IIA component|nr:PTS sugar transporter subunit IIA [Thermoanaerobaculia bacterium]